MAICCWSRQEVSSSDRKINVRRLEFVLMRCDGFGALYEKCVTKLFPQLVLTGAEEQKTAQDTRDVETRHLSVAGGARNSTATQLIIPCFSA